MDSGADGLVGLLRCGVVEIEERGVLLDWPNECAAVAEMEVEVDGVGGSERFRLSADCRLPVLACNEGFSFFFFLRKPRVGMQGSRVRVEKGEALVTGYLRSLCAFRVL